MEGKLFLKNFESLNHNSLPLFVFVRKHLVIFILL